MKKLLIISFFSLCSQASKSQTIIWNAHEKFEDIGKKIFVLKDKSGKLDITQVSDSSFNSKFFLSKQSILHFGFSKSVYWLKFSLHNSTKDSLWLEVAHAFLPHVDLYYRNQAGGWICYKSGYKVNLNDKIIKHHFQIFPLPKSTQDFYVRFIPYLHPMPIRIWNYESYEIKSNRQKIIYGLYMGILLFAIVINLFLFFAFNKVYYFLYSLLVFLYILTSAAVMDGYILYIFPNLDLMYWYKIIPVLDMPVLLFYCISFFELKKYHPRLYRVSLITSFYFILHIVLLNFFPLMTVLLINQIYALMAFVFGIVIGITVGRRGNKLGYYFAIAYSIWFMLISIEAIYIQVGSPAHILELSYVSIAIFIEAFLLAYLLAKRFEWEKKNDQRVQLGMQYSITQMQYKFQQTLLQTQLEIQEQTFKNISQEIHDNIGQVLSLVKLNINTMDRDKPEPLQEKIDNSRTLITKAIQDLRDLSKSLNTDYVIELGLMRSIEYELEMIQRNVSCEIAFTTNGKAYRLERQQELILFRIVQEVLHNIIKHAKATAINVTAVFERETFMLTIADNGIGFDAGKIEDNNYEGFGLGIRNMHNRAKMINADYKLTSTLQKGTTVTITLPVTKNIQP